MRVLIVDGDDLVADLLALIVEGLPARPTAFRAATLAEAFDLWRSAPPDLVLCDWNLPDGSGLTFIKHIRKASVTPPVVIVTAQSDRDSVIAAAKHAVSAYITKPFQVDAVRERLSALIPGSQTSAPVAESDSSTFPAQLDHAVRYGTTLFNITELTDVLALRNRMDTLSLSELGSAWRGNAVLHARLIQFANAGYLRRGPDPVVSLPGALRVLGARVALDIALASALDPSARLRCDALKGRASKFLETGDRIAQTAVALAKELGLDEDECVAAGMLHQTGELGVLSIAQQHIDNGGSLDEAVVDTALKSQSARLGARLKTQFRLPLSLKQLIGATHQLPAGAVHVRLPLMRLAALVAQGEETSPECERLKQRLGITRQFT
ncbi:MAG: response regulator [Ectothiorhodospiraceae bacterium]|nr:response regulator [Ectothiorhodospiraceae bacterium]